MMMTLRERWSESTAAFFERPLSRLRLGYAAWLFGAFCYFLPAATWSPVSRFDLTRAIVEQHTLVIDSFADRFSRVEPRRAGRPPRFRTPAASTAISPR